MPARARPLVLPAPVSARPGLVELGVLTGVVAGSVTGGVVAGSVTGGVVVAGGVVPGSVGVGEVVTVIVAFDEAESVCTPAKASFCTPVGRSGFTRAQPPSTGAEPVAVTTTSPVWVPAGTSTQTWSPSPRW